MGYHQRSNKMTAMPIDMPKLSKNASYISGTFSDPIPRTDRHRSFQRGGEAAVRQREPSVDSEVTTELDFVFDEDELSDPEPPSTSSSSSTDNEAVKSLNMLRGRTRQRRRNSWIRPPPTPSTDGSASVSDSILEVVRVQRKRKSSVSLVSLGLGWNADMPQIECKSLPASPSLDTSVARGIYATAVPSLPSTPTYLDDPTPRPPPSFPQLKRSGSFLASPRRLSPLPPNPQWNLRIPNFAAKIIGLATVRDEGSSGEREGDDYFAVPSPPPRSSPARTAHVIKVEVNYAPNTPSGKTCQKLIAKIRRSLESDAYQRPLKLFTTILNVDQVGDTAVLVTYTDGLRTKISPSDSNIKSILNLIESPPTTPL